ncbi:MAG: hypothetical protein AB8I08_18960 [Sandaracinaceae bacterium]
MKTQHLYFACILVAGLLTACGSSDSELPPVGTGCGSVGGTPCTCPDGTETCSSHTGSCPCGDDSYPHDDEERLEEPPPTPALAPGGGGRPGSDCSSYGVECTCPDGRRICAPHSTEEGSCPCEEDSPDEEEPVPPRPPTVPAG